MVAEVTVTAQRTHDLRAAPQPAASPTHYMAAI
jgi:hypothetical protein